MPSVPEHLVGPLANSQAAAAAAVAKAFPLYTAKGGGDDDDDRTVSIAFRVGDAPVSDCAATKRHGAFEMHHLVRSVERACT